MKNITILTAALILVGSVSAGAQTSQKELEVTLSCDCAEWALAENGEMKLRRARSGMSTFPRLTAESSAYLAKAPFYQTPDSKKGYASVSATSFKLYSIKMRNPELLDDYTLRCKQEEQRLGLVACGATVTFPINEKAAEIYGK